MMNVRKVIGALVVITIIVVLGVPTSNLILAQGSSQEATGNVPPASNSILAQEATEVPPTSTPLPTPTAFPMQGLGFTLIGHADIEIGTDGQVLASAATLSLPP